MGLLLASKVTHDDGIFCQNRAVAVLQTFSYLLGIWPKTVMKQKHNNSGGVETGGIDEEYWGNDTTMNIIAIRAAVEV